MRSRVPAESAGEIPVEHVAQPGEEQENAAGEERPLRHHHRSPSAQHETEQGHQQRRDSERRQQIHHRLDELATAVLKGAFVHGDGS